MKSLGDIFARSNPFKVDPNQPSVEQGTTTGHHEHADEHADEHGRGNNQRFGVAILRTRASMADIFSRRGFREGIHEIQGGKAAALETSTDRADSSVHRKSLIRKMTGVFA